jgi:hypothetical protein
MGEARVRGTPRESNGLYEQIANVATLSSSLAFKFRTCLELRKFRNRSRDYPSPAPPLALQPKNTLEVKTKTLSNDMSGLKTRCT